MRGCADASEVGVLSWCARASKLRGRQGSNLYALSIPMNCQALFDTSDDGARRTIELSFVTCLDVSGLRGTGVNSRLEALLEEIKEETDG